MVELDCCNSLVHAACINVHLDHRRLCIRCLHPLHPINLASIRVLAAHETVCAICQDPVVCTTALTQCDHWYHGYCLAKWVETGDENSESQSCPVCREPILKTELLDRLIVYMTSKTLEMYMERSDFRTLPTPLQNSIERRVREEYPVPFEDCVSFEWSNEKILSLLYEEFEWEWTAGERSYLRTEISRIHECTEECDYRACLPRRWIELYKPPMQVAEIL